jgi:hemolysin III
MVGTSMAYNRAPPGRVKAVLRRLDHAMIFVMIAGCYTPFALNGLQPAWGVPLCVLIWGLAALGCSLKLAASPYAARTDVALYLGLGWLPLPWFIAALPGVLVTPLLAGGVAYSLGSVVHARSRMRFHNALWHFLVLIGAALHFTAIAMLLLPR